MIRNGKKTFWAIVGIIVLAACVLTYFRMGPKTFRLKQKIPASVRMKVFQGTNPPFNFTFEYPEAWKAKETQAPKQNLNMVQVLGPKDPISEVVPGIFVTLKKIRQKAVFSTVAGAIPGREKRFKTFKELSRTEEQVGGVKALHLGFEYALPLPMRSKRAKDTILKREEVYLERNGSLYRISFWLTEEQFKIYKPVIDHVLDTFEFKD